MKISSSFRIKVLTAIASVAVINGVSAQAISQACFSYIYEATTAKNATSLQSALDDFTRASCEKSFTEKATMVSATSTPTMEAAVFLAYQQSQKRLEALRLLPSTPIFRPMPIISPPSGGTATARKIQVSIMGVDGKLFSAEVPESAFSTELREKLPGKIAGFARP